jgi:2-oxoglutarate dehydrogenase E2 component (dihydrolipoamide succinyltransferase)
MDGRPLATLARWHRDDGEFVRLGDPICEIETDKALVDIAASRDGILRHLAKIGDAICAGDEVARIDPVQ